MSQMGKGVEILENFVVSPAGIDAKHGVALQPSYSKKCLSRFEARNRRALKCSNPCLSEN